MTFDERPTGLPEISNAAGDMPAASAAGVAVRVSELEDVDRVDGDAGIKPEMSAEDIATALAKHKAKRLKSAAGKIHKARKAITEKLLRIADLLDGAKNDLRRSSGGHGEGPAVSPAKLRAFAHIEAGVPRDEISTYLQLAKTSPTERAVLREQGAGFAVLKAIATDAGLRADVINRMQAKISMDIEAVRRVRRTRKLEAETQLQTLLRQQPELSQLAGRAELRDAIRVFDNETFVFAQELVAFHNAVELSDEEYSVRGNEIALTAKTLLKRLDAIIETDDMPYSFQELWHSGCNPRGFEASILALRLIGCGKFLNREEDGAPDTDDVNIDWHLVAAIGRLAGMRPEEFDQASRGAKRRGKRSDRGSAAPKTPKLLEAPKPLRSIEICAGAGGQALGLHAAGFHARAIFELMNDAAETLRANFNTSVPRVFTEDITKVDFGHYRDGIDLVAGGVPCQPWSTAGARRGDADDRDLFRRAVEIVDEIKPRAFFFENVQGFGHSTNISYRAELHAAFEAIGYQSRVFPIIGSDYGLAQGRPRVAFIGFKDPDVMARFKMPPVFPHWHLRLADAIGDLVSANGWRGYEAWRTIANCTAPTIVGGSRKSDKHSFSSGLTRQAWADLGIDSSSLTKSAPAAGHQGLFKLTLEMGARLQGFPDDWQFIGRPQQIKSQIGNALPPVMARAVGLAIHAALEDVTFDFEKALKAPLRVPTEKPRPLSSNPRARFGLRSPAAYARHLWLNQIRQEHEFFGEVHRDFDEFQGEIETFINPGSYKLKNVENLETSD